MNEKDVISMLREQFGIERVPFRLKIMGKGRVYAYLNCFKDIEEYHSGVYFGKVERDGFRLSIEGCYLLKDQIKRNIKEVNFQEMLRWLRGEDIDGIETGYVILKWKDYFLGCGRGNGKRIRNFVPKDRRLR